MQENVAAPWAALLYVHQARYVQSPPLSVGTAQTSSIIIFLQPKNQQWKVKAYLFYASTHEGQDINS